MLTTNIDSKTKKEIIKSILSKINSKLVYKNTAPPAPIFTSLSETFKTPLYKHTPFSIFFTSSLPDYTEVLSKIEMDVLLCNSNLNHAFSPDRTTILMYLLSFEQAHSISLGNRQIPFKNLDPDQISYLIENTDLNIVNQHNNAAIHYAFPHAFPSNLTYENWWKLIKGSPLNTINYVGITPVIAALSRNPTLPSDQIDYLVKHSNKKIIKSSCSALLLSLSTDHPLREKYLLAFKKFENFKETQLLNKAIARPNQSSSAAKI